MFTDGEHKFKVRKRKFKAVEHKFIDHKHKIELVGNRKPSGTRYKYNKKVEMLKLR